MATVSKRLRKTGTDPSGKPLYRQEGWKVRYVDAEGRERLNVFPKKSEADVFRAKVEHTKALGTYVDVDAGRMTFEDYAESWRAAQPHRPGTRATVESRLRLHIYPAIGSMRLSTIRPTTLQALVTDRAEHMAPATLESVAGYVRTVFKAAVADRLIGSSPATDLRLPNVEDRPPIVPLERGQWEALAAAMPARWRASVALAVGTGLRQGEALGLSIDRVDFFRREILVDRQLVTPATGEPAFGPPKTKRSRRSVPVPQAVIDGIAAHLVEFPAGEDGLIFTNRRRGPVRRTRFSDAVRAAAIAAGLPEKARYHLLRHTYASLLIRAGCSVKVVQARLGHASAVETLQTYSHMWPDDDDRTRDAIAAALFSPEASESDQDRTVTDG